MRNYPVKDNQIGSAVSKKLWYKQTNCYFIIRIFFQKALLTSLFCKLLFQTFGPSVLTVRIQLHLYGYFRSCFLMKYKKYLIVR